MHRKISRPSGMFCGQTQGGGIGTQRFPWKRCGRNIQTPSKSFNDWAKGKSSTVLPPEEIREKTGQQGVRFSLGNPIPGSVEFAAPRVSQGFLNRTRGSRLVLKHRNWFISTRYSQRFPQDWPQMRKGGIVTPQVLVAAGVVVAGAVAGMFLLG